LATFLKYQLILSGKLRKSSLLARYIGEAVCKLDDNLLVTGRGSFVDDVNLPNMTFAKIVRSPYAHAKIKGIDTSKAEKLEGVYCVLTGPQIIDTIDPFPPFFKDFPGLRYAKCYPLAIDEVRYVGEPVAVVVASDRFIAEDAAELVSVEYEELPVIVDAEKALEKDAPLLYPEWGDNIFVKWEMKSEGVDDAFSKADYVFKDRYKSHRYTGTPIETRGLICDYDPYADMLTIWTSKQDPYVQKLMMAVALNQPENRIRVITPSVGGGFGIKLNLFAEDVVIGYAARRLKRPVKWIEERREHLMACTHAREQIHYLEAAVRKDGKILALRDRIIGDVGTGMIYPHTGVGSCKFSGDIITGPYKIENVQYDIFCVVTNKFPYGAYRGFGQPEATFAMERMMDKIARALRIDRVELRIKNMISREDFPYRSPSGQIYDSGDYIGELQQVTKMIDYKSFEAFRQRKIQEGKFVGLGVACNVESTACTIAFLPLGAHEASAVKIEADGKVSVRLGAASIGTGLETTVAQIVADRLGVPIEDVRVVSGDTFGGPYSLGLYGSRGAVVCGSSAAIAADRLREKTISIAASMFEARAEDIDIRRGEIYVKGTPAGSLRYKDIAQIAYNEIYKLPKDIEPGLECTAYFNPPLIRGHAEADGKMNVTGAMTSSSHAVIVEIDPKSGKIQILDYAICHDCGTIINPMIVEGQIHGGLAQGLGGAMMEELVYDENGQLLTSTFMDYLIPSTMEVPNVKVHHMQIPSPYIPNGIKGTGEAALISPPAAMASAIEDAFRDYGLSIHETPLSPDRVWQLVNEAMRRNRN
jgi:carbon-monoxide dehydrogenase large subunit